MPKTRMPSMNRLPRLRKAKMLCLVPLPIADVMRGAPWQHIVLSITAFAPVIDVTFLCVMADGQLVCPYSSLTQRETFSGKLMATLTPSKEYGCASHIFAMRFRNGRLRSVRVVKSPPADTWVAEHLGLTRKFGTKRYVVLSLDTEKPYAQRVREARDQAYWLYWRKGV